MNSLKTLAIGSIVVGILVLLLKAVAWKITGSAALYSDALESTVNVATALAAFAAITYAQRPADKTHPYGHHKAEYFSAVLEGVMIVIAALMIFWEAIDAWLHPQMITEAPHGLLVSGVATTLNGIWSYVLIKKGRDLRSPALEADGRHLWSDVVSSIGVVLGVVVVILTGWVRLDALIAFFVAINILISGTKVLRNSLGGLLDEAVAPDVLKRIEGIIKENAEGAIEAHDVRTREAGSVIYVEFHLVVDGEISVNAAHKICDHIEAALRQQFPDVQVSIHVEPEEKAKHKGAVVIN